ncbi:MAG: hypothetical protein ABR597_09845, partial [Bacteroidales bacterium]
MKTTIYYFLAAIVISLVSLTVEAQRGYTRFDNEEDMEIMYRWQRASVFDKESDAVLNIRVTNQNDSAVNWTYAIGFYIDGMLVFESETYELCLKEGQSRRGGLAGLRFSMEGIRP